MLETLASGLLIAVSVCLFVPSVSTLFLATYAWWNLDKRDSTTFAPVQPGRMHSFSLIMPCRHEREEVVRATLERLLGQSHPKVEVIISVGHDDPETIATANLLAKENPSRVRVSIDEHEKKNKPTQLNTALTMCRNDIVGVFDAESIAAPELLDRIDGAFQQRDADVVQGAVQLINFRDSWYSLRNCLEYFIWFRSRLHAHAQRGFIPLGGNTVFVRRELLVSVGGWDPNCLAEDCDLGVRLSALKSRIVVAYAPELVTREETPESLRALVKQRTRWSLGFMQVYAKGDWRALPVGRQRFNAWWTLTQQHFMAFAGVCIPLAVVLAIVGKFPLAVTMVTFLPLLPTLALIALEACMLHEFGQDHNFKVRLRDYFRLILGAPLYQLVLAYAAIRAVTKFYRRDFAWEKTTHTGAHLSYLEAS
jgi:cellulose synthase/poly-beta-1,6-N-acetylglucosamine synthase-like glycosyltransferase